MPFSSFVRNHCSARLGCVGSSGVALYLAGAKRALQPREPEAILMLHGFRFLGLAFVWCRVWCQQSYLAHLPNL